MKCPVCQAKLLPVDGELFCLQCGRSLHRASADASDDLHLEDTVDPVLQRAIRDAGDGLTQFQMEAAKAEPVAAPAIVPKAKPTKVEPATVAVVAARHSAKPKRSFASLHTMLAAPRAISSGGVLIVGPSMSVQVGEAVHHEALARPVKFRHVALRAWTIGFAVFAGFMALNLAVGNYYSERVYPGVKVSGVAVGGWTFDELKRKLPMVLPQPTLAATIGAKQYPLAVTEGAAMSQEALWRAVERSGRQAPLPIVGVIGSWFQDPIRPSYSLSSDTVSRSVEQLAAQVDRAASNAFITTIGSNVFVVADKPGSILDKTATATAIQIAYGHTGKVALSLVQQTPAVVAADWVGEVTAAQTMIGQTVQVNVKKAHYTPTPAQIAGWSVFGAPGKGVTVDPAGVAAYVAAIPGSFDRTAAVDGLVAALNAHQGATLAPSTRHITSNPNPVSTAQAVPLITYTYCLSSSSSTAADFATASATILGQGGGWTLGGRVRYTLAQTGCNMMLQIGDTAALTALDPACGQQTSCRIHNDLAIKSDNWAAAPTTWKGALPAYRAELVNQVVGQWLGFDHPSCQNNEPSVLATPSVTVPGCSPQWYPVPPELQDTKVLAGV